MNTSCQTSAAADGVETATEDYVTMTVAGQAFGIPVLSVRDWLLYTSDAADDLPCVALGGRRIIKKKNTTQLTSHHQ